MSLLKLRFRKIVPLTSCQLHPCTDLVNAAWVAEEKQTKADNSPYDQQQRDPNEEHSGFKGTWRDGSKVQSTALTHQLSCDGVPNAIVKEPKVAWLRGVNTVSNPVRLNEDHHTDDGEADGEDSPQHTDGPRVSYIICVIDLGSLLGR